MEPSGRADRRRSSLSSLRISIDHQAEGMGGGDIKLLAMIGSFSGLKGVLFSLIGGSVVGTLVGIPLMLMKGKEEGGKYAIPFGPFLSLCALLYLFVGPGVVHAVSVFLLYR